MNKQKLKVSKKKTNSLLVERHFMRHNYDHTTTHAAKVPPLYSCDFTICRNDIFSSCNLIRNKHTMWHENTEVILFLLHDARNQTSWHFMQHVPGTNFCPATEISRKKIQRRACHTRKTVTEWNMPPCHVRVAFPLACATLYKQLNSIELGKMGD